MDLYLMRHGEALAKHAAGVGTDAERPLSPGGSEVVDQVGRALKALALKPDRILTSPLVRARQTAERVARELGCVDRIEQCQALLPEQDPAAFIESLRQLHADGVILAVGHQPSLGRLATQLVFGEARDGLALRPAGMCWLQLPDFPRSLEAVLRGLWNPESLMPPSRTRTKIS